MILTGPRCSMAVTVPLTENWRYELESFQWRWGGLYCKVWWRYGGERNRQQEDREIFFLHFLTF